MEITLEEAAAGKDAQIRIPSWDDCGICRGNGAKPGTKVATCTTCHGHGVVQMRQGFFSVQQNCPQCKGTGKLIAEPCVACHGVGKTKTNKTLEVKIPGGIDDGMRIRSTANGEPGSNGGPPGDLYIEIRIKKHEIFEREGDDLHCVVPVSFPRASLGGEIEVPTLDGSAKMKVPAETQTGSVFRLRGKGIKPLRQSEHGDLMVHVVVVTQVKLTTRQKEILREFDESTQADSGKHSPKSKSWLDKAKEFFE
jgi:molecular chaperone DnaJ